DHPWAGFASGSGILLTFNDYLPEDYLRDQEENSVGKSFESYKFGGKQWALPIDAATPVASYRPDILEETGESVPGTWEDLLALVKKVKVAMAGIPIDVLMNFYMLCITQGGKIFQNDETVVDEETGILALRQLRELASSMTPEIFEWNPIKVYEAMTSRDDIAYCPFAYGYNNYSRRGYAKHRLVFTDLVSIGEYGLLQSTLGGTGIAVSARCLHKEIAVDYARFTASPECQSTLYYYSGGQPGHRKAWLDDEINAHSLNYFKNTLKALDRAYLRPRYNGYLYFQDHAGDPVQDYLKNGGDEKAVLQSMDVIYRKSKGI
ncbi:MAG TPA: extracellular solute-binding protein, partial [bacterium]|nr:extracellular solute-binding protein [bacterium]